MVMKMAMNDEHGCGDDNGDDNGEDDNDSDKESELQSSIRNINGTRSKGHWQW